MTKLRQAAAALTAACALAAFSFPASAGHFGGAHMGRMGHGHFAGGFGRGGWGHHHRHGGFGFYPGFAFYGGPYYDDYYYNDYDYSYCWWRHGRRFCRY